MPDVAPVYRLPRTVQGPPFAMVPDFVWGTCSSAAVMVWCAMSKHADRDTGECRLRRKTIAEEARVSVDTVDRARRELVRCGALVEVATERADGSRGANVYRLVYGRDLQGGGGTHAQGGGGTHAQGILELEPEGTKRTPQTPQRGASDASVLRDRDREYEPITKASQVHRTAQDERRAARQEGKRSQKPVVGQPAPPPARPVKPTNAELRRELEAKVKRMKEEKHGR